MRGTTAQQRRSSWFGDCTRLLQGRAFAIGILALAGHGCFYIPRPRDDVNSPPRIQLPETNPATYLMIAKERNPATVVATDPDGDRLTAVWMVPGYGLPLDISRSDDGDLTIFQLLLPRVEELDGRTVEVLVIDDDPEDPRSVTVKFTVEVP